MARTHYDDDVVRRRDVVYEEEADSRVERGYSAMSVGSIPARVNAVLGALLLGLETLLALRFVLAAFGANPNSGFVDFIYDVSHPFVAPFNNVFNDRTWDQGIIEVNTLLAMGVYLLAYVLIALLINAAVPRMYHGSEAASTTRSTRV